MALGVQASGEVPPSLVAIVISTLERLTDDEETRSAGEEAALETVGEGEELEIAGEGGWETVDEGEGSETVDEAREISAFKAFDSGKIASMQRMQHVKEHTLDG